MVLKAPKPGKPNLRVITKDEDKVVLDGNHPLAGKALNFEIEVVAVISPGDKDDMGERHETSKKSSSTTTKAKKKQHPTPVEEVSSIEPSAAAALDAAKSISEIQKSMGAIRVDSIE